MTSAPFFSYAQQRQSTIPKPCNAALLCPLIPSRVCSGDDIEARIDDRVYACRIIDIIFDYSPPRLLVKIWLSESELPTGADTLPSLNPSTDGRIIGMRGVLHSNWLYWITTESVTDFAYIIHHESLLSGMYTNVFGMRNAYFCRYDIFSVHVQSHSVRKYEA